MFEEFPAEEYEQRLAVVRQAMKLNRLDALLVTTEINLRYLAGLVNCYWLVTMGDDLQAALIPADESHGSVLFGPDHICHGAAGGSWIRDKRAWPQFSTGTVPAPVKTITDTVVEKDLDGARVGIEIGPNARLGMPPAYFDQLRHALPQCHFADCEAMLSRVRSIKSPSEIACIRRACEITCEGMMAGINAVAQGVSEMEIGQRIVQRWGEVSNDFSSARPWFMYIYSSPYRSQWFDCGPSDYRLRKGDYVVLDIGYCYKGYMADMFRTACIGKPDALLEKFFAANRLANLAGIDRIAAGVKAADVALAVVDTWKRIGLASEVAEQLEAHNYDFVGHGLGLTLHEEPLINTHQQRELQGGMYLAIEGMLTDCMPFSEAKVCVGIEHDVLITESGCECLTAAVPDELFVR